MTLESTIHIGRVGHLDMQKLKRYKATNLTKNYVDTNKAEVEVLHGFLIEKIYTTKEMDERVLELMSELEDVKEDDICVEVEASTDYTL